MKIETRLILSLFIRLALMGFAAWFAIFPEALPGAGPITRIAMASGFLILSILVGEVAALRSHMTMIVRAFRAASSGDAPQVGPTDDREAVQILIRALRSGDADTRDKVHRHLKRLTGQDLPADPDAWEAWWSEHGDEFKGS